jgi:hypothetical protein
MGHLIPKQYADALSFNEEDYIDALLEFMEID